MTREEYAQWLEYCQRCEQGGNDGADVYEADEFCRELSHKYGKPFPELLATATSEFQPKVIEREL